MPLKIGFICVTDMINKQLVFNSHGKKVYYDESDSEITVYDEYGDNPKNYMKPRYRLDEVGQNEEVRAPIISIDDKGGTEEEYEESEAEGNFWKGF